MRIGGLEGILFSQECIQGTERRDSRINTITNTTKNTVIVALENSFFDLKGLDATTESSSILDGNNATISACDVATAKRFFGITSTDIILGNKAV